MAHFVSDHRTRVPQGVQLLDFLGPLGMTGLTAYFVRVTVHALLARLHTFVRDSLT